MKYLILLISILMLVGCSNSVENDIFTKEAMLIWNGEYAVDGCGFSIEIENQIYKPENENIIPDEFKTSSNTKVNIRFEYLDDEIEYFCGDFRGPQKKEGIKIVSIKKI